MRADAPSHFSSPIASLSLRPSADPSVLALLCSDPFDSSALSPTLTMTGEAHVPFALGAITSVQPSEPAQAAAGGRRENPARCSQHQPPPHSCLRCSLCLAVRPFPLFCSALGGLMGYAKSRSRISLVAGVAVGALFAVSGKLIQSGEAEQV